MKTNPDDKHGDDTSLGGRRSGRVMRGGGVSVWRAGWVTVCLVFLAGCGRKEAAVAAVAKESRHAITGEILAVKAEEKVLRVRHEAIEGYMPAMTMEFGVEAGDLANAKPGQRIRAELVESGDGEVRLEKIWPADPAKEASIDAAARTLMQDTVSKGKGAYRELGETVPEFSLYDQEGAVVTSGRFRGKMVMLNFIFTRCPIAAMCPAAVLRFQTTQRLAREAGVKDLELISITLDPAHDTPGVLKTYALQRAIDTSNYTLLTGPEMAIKSLLAQFGVIAELQGDLLNHTLATLLIDENGRIVHRADGSQWEASDFVRRMKRR